MLFKCSYIEVNEPKWIAIIAGIFGATCLFYLIRLLLCHYGFCVSHIELLSISIPFGCFFYKYCRLVTYLLLDVIISCIG